MGQQTTSEQQRAPTAATEAGSPPESLASEPIQQPTQTPGDRALRLISSLLSFAFGSALVLVVGGLGLRFVFMGVGNESLFSILMVLAAVCFLPATLLTALVVGLVASVPIHIVRSRIVSAGSLRAKRGDRAFSISCLSIVAMGACIAALAFVTKQASPRVPREERVALAALYESAGGDNWDENTGWLSWRPPCRWEGVVCTSDSSPVHIKALRLEHNQLSGNIPPELSNLSHLKQLYLFDNQLSGVIPPELGRLSDLEEILLMDNQLSGVIPPALGSLSSLEYLRLSGNQLTGPIPPELGSLANLVVLHLGGNQLNGGIPAELGRLANLEELYLNENQLTGPIPSELGRLSNLWYLYLNENRLTGSPPSELGALSTLYHLYLDHNPLNGSLPPELSGLAKMSEFYFNDTDLCEPADPAFQEWLAGIRESGRTGVTCP